MRPQIGIGDIVFTKEAENIAVNDIISYKKDGMTITHRVIEIVAESGTEKYRTKGDYNNSEDAGLVEKENIEGIVVFKINKIGHVLMFLKTKLGMVILALIFAIAYKQGKTAEKKRKERKMKRNIYDLQIIKENLKSDK